ncbi:MAG: hypothetical protein J6K18_05820 [Bacilli bacterium]|nr:hypothetical protein [Bacilli bacterium]
MEKYGDFSKYNDYELLYLIKANVEEAREILFWKYSFLIKSRINRLGVPRFYWDDYYQEGCLMLHRAIKIYDENSRMSFTKFFELLLKRRIITLLRKDLKEFQVEKMEDFDEYPSYIIEQDTYSLLESCESNLSEIEKIAYERLMMNNEKVENVSKELGLNSKSLSNAKQRALRKIKKELNK